MALITSGVRLATILNVASLNISLVHFPDTPFPGGQSSLSGHSILLG
jgi:hypothetical protein